MHFIVAIIIAIAALWAWPIFFKQPSVIPLDSPLQQLSEVDRTYYQQVFDYAMNYTQANENYGWQTTSGEGKIYVSKIFTSKSGATCRNFTEHFTVNDTQGSDEGIACRRGEKDSWCRLKSTDALTCAMEAPANIVDKASDESNRAVEKGKEILGTISGWIR